MRPKNTAIKPPTMFRGALLRSAFLLALCWPLSGLCADFTLEDLQGKTHRLSDYRGKWVLVNFWAIWCPPCLNEIPELNSLYNARKDIVVIGIARDYASAKEVADFVKKRGISYPVVLGNREITAQIGKVELLPTSYLYNPEGEQVSYQAGEITRDDVERYIKRQQ